MIGAILVAEDQDTARESLSELLREEGYQVYEALDGDAALKLVEEVDLDIILADLRMPGKDGIEILKSAREISPQTLVIIMTAHATVDTAVEALRLGAQDYILKPLVFEDVLRKVQHLMEHRSLAWEIQMLRREGNRHVDLTQLVGRSQLMQDIFTLIEKVAPTNAPGLLTGEGG